MVTPINRNRKKRYELTKDQEQFLRENYNYLSNHQMAIELRTTTWTIAKLLKMLGLEKTLEEIEAIKKRQHKVGSINSFHVVLHYRNEERAKLVEEATLRYQTLGFGELPLLWRMYRKGMKKSQVCRELNISEEHCMECLEVCQMIWGYGPRLTDKVPQAEPPTVGDAAQKLREEHAPSAPIVRPPAVYSNRSPYGIASPGI